MPKYTVLEPGFYGNILRKPGGRHDPVVTAKPIPKAKMPSWLTPFVEPKGSPESSPAPEPSPAPEQTEVEAQVEADDSSVDDAAGLESV